MDISKTVTALEALAAEWEARASHAFDDMAGAEGLAVEACLKDLKAVIADLHAAEAPVVTSVAA